MSAFTTKIRELLKTRHWYSKSTAVQVPQDELSPHDVVLTRIICTFNPSRAAVNAKGDLVPLSGSMYPYEHVANYYEGINFAPPPAQYWSRTIDNDEYLNDYWWFRKDYTLQQLTDFGLNREYVDCVIWARALMQKLLQRLDWIPAGIKGKWLAAVDAGGIPQLYDTETIVNISKSLDPAKALPSFLRDKPIRQAAWNQVVGMLHPVNRRITAIGTRIYAEEAAKIDADVAFWEGVSKYTGVDAVMGLWEDLKSKVRSFNGNQAAARTAADQAALMLDANPALDTPANRQKVAALQAEIQNHSTVIRQKIPEALMQPLAAEAGGLGLAVVTAAIIGGTLMAVTVSAVAVLVTQSEHTARNGQDIVGDFAAQMAAYDNAAYENAKADIKNRRAQLEEYFQDGYLTSEEYTAEVALLKQELAEVESTYMAKRKQAREAVSELADKMKAQQRDDAVTGGLKALRGAAIPISVGLGILILGPSVARMLNGKKP